MGIPAELKNGDGAMARAKMGKDQYLQFRETDRALPDYDGHHVQMYITNFSGPYRRLLDRGLVSQEDNPYQYRFRDIVDLAVRPAPVHGGARGAQRSPIRCIMRPLVNRNPASTNQHLRARPRPVGAGRWDRTSTTGGETSMLPSQRDLFDIPRDICYLNSASYSPLPLKTLRRPARAAVGRKGQPWMLDPGFAGRQHDRARIAAARLINADAADIALISSISYGVATAAKLLTIPRGTRVLVLENDHSSPVLEWQTRADAQGFVVETVRQPGDGDWTSAVLAAIERPGAAPVALASISSVHWSDGGLIDLEKVTTALRRQGALFLIDATQSAGVLPLDAKQLDPDFVIFPTYKWLLGPYGRAFLYVAKRHQGGVPLEQTPGGRRDVRAENAVYFSDTSYVGDASRFDMGERDHFVSLEMAAIGMEMMAEWGAAAVAQRLADADGADRGRRARSRRRRPAVFTCGRRISCASASRTERQKRWSKGLPPRTSTWRRASAACASRPTSSTTRPMPTALLRRWAEGCGISQPWPAGYPGHPRNCAAAVSHLAISAATSVRGATRRPSPRRAEPRPASRSAG